MCMCMRYGENYALRKNAYQYQGVYDKANASLAVDGNTSHNFLDWSCSHTNGSINTQAYWTVDLGVPVVVTGIIIYNRNELQERLKSFSIISGRSTEDVLYDDTSGQNQYLEDVIRITPNILPASQNITIQIPPRTGEVSYLTLCEVEVYAAAICQKPDSFKSFLVIKNERQRYFYGENVTLSCESGYEPSSSISLVCGSNAKWNNTLPECKAVSCEQLPSQDHGSYDVLNKDVCPSDETSSLYYKCRVKLECHEGFRLVNDTELECNNKGQWTNSSTICEKITCSYPGYLSYGYYISSEGIHYSNGFLTFGTLIKAQCKKGYELNGTAERRCQNDSKWSGETPLCDRVKCNVYHLTTLGTAASFYLEEEKIYPDTRVDVNTTLRIYCKEGYALQLDQPKITCLADGNWSNYRSDQRLCADREETGSSTHFSPTAIIGAFSGVFVFIAAVVSIIVFGCRRIKNRNRNYRNSVHLHENPEENTRISGAEIIQEDAGRQNENENSVRRGANSRKSSIPVKNQYYSFTDSPSKIPKSAILNSDLSDIVLCGGARNRYENEFKTLPDGLTEKHSEAVKAQNKSKNRYRNMYAYDETRVVLQKDTPEESDYINACYIDGFQTVRAYIATQGPKTDDFADFWKMIWQVDCNKIVMLTNLIEEMKQKCDKYWPDSGSITYGKVSVSFEASDTFSDCVIRTFKITDKRCSQEKLVRQFHYTAWPDKGVPQYTSSLVQFRDKVVNYPCPTKGPIVVHCSAGVGRTGTFIALDVLTNQAKETGYVDVIGTVKALRKQRVKLVQTLEQYIFVYRALTETLMLTTSALSSEKFPKAYRELQDIDSKTGKRKIVQEFEMMKKLSPVADAEQYVSAASVRNRNKNRYVNILPAEEYMPRLLSETSNTDGYINAVFLPSHKEKKAFIITQTPLETTKGDFWRLVCEQNVHIVVMMNHVNEMDPKEIYWPMEGDTLTFGTMKVSYDAMQMTDVNTVISLVVHSPAEKRTVSLIQYNAWKPKVPLPETPVSFLKLLELVQNQQKNAGSHTVLVHCMNGADKSGLFCVVSAVIERLKIEQDVAISQTIQDMRHAREQLIPSVEQFQFCHEAVLEFIIQNATYSNFT